MEDIKKLAVGTRIKYNGIEYIIKGRDKYGYNVTHIDVTLDPIEDECKTGISYNAQKDGLIEVISELPGFVKFDEVVFKPMGSVWHYGVFMKEDDDHIYLFDNLQIWKDLDMILPYDGNENLIGTDEEPPFVKSNDKILTVDERNCIIDILNKEMVKINNSPSRSNMDEKRFFQCRDIIHKLK